MQLHINEQAEDTFKGLTLLTTTCDSTKDTRYTNTDAKNWTDQNWAQWYFCLPYNSIGL